MPLLFSTRCSCLVEYLINRYFLDADLRRGVFISLLFVFSCIFLSHGGCQIKISIKEGQVNIMVQHLIFDKSIYRSCSITCSRGMMKENIFIRLIDLFIEIRSEYTLFTLS